MHIKLTQTRTSNSKQYSKFNFNYHDGCHHHHLLQTELLETFQQAHLNEEPFLVCWYLFCICVRYHQMSMFS